jgi:hypothetical protein
MIGGKKGHPGGKMTRAEAVPAIRTKSNNKVPINAILFIFLPPLLFQSKEFKLPIFHYPPNIFTFKTY